MKTKPIIILTCLAAVIVVSIVSQPAMLKYAKLQNCGLTNIESKFTYSWSLKWCAQNGDTDAMAWLGMMYWSDVESYSRQIPSLWTPMSVPTLKKQGFEYMTKAAKKGSVIAANELGLAYMNANYDVPKDVDKAIKWLKYADRHGDVFAPQNLAILYTRGTDIAYSEDRAVMYLERSAERGSLVSLWTIGSYYLAKDTPESVAKAERYFLKANQLGGECARPSEICDDFKNLFDEEALISANKYITEMETMSC